MELVEVVCEWFVVSVGIMFENLFVISGCVSLVNIVKVGA